MNIDFRLIENITSNYSNVTENTLYVAIKGEKFDGTKYIDQAIAKGARCVLLQGERDEVIRTSDGVKYYYVENVKKACSVAASIVYNKQPETIVAVTGTNGKTSTVDYYRQMAQLFNLRSASIGTLGVQSDSIKDWCNKYNQSKSNILTTPDSIDLHSLLHSIAELGINHLAIEASSHGLVQHRLHNVNIKAAGFTNLTHDHLDYHEDFNSYLNAKLILFTEILKPGATAVVNLQAIHANEIIDGSTQNGLKIITYGTAEADIFIISQTENNVNFSVFNEQYSLEMTNIISFHLENMMCAIGLAYATLNIPLNELMSYIPKLQQPLGRMDMVATYKGARIYIDYAHTPDALKNAMASVINTSKNLNKLHILFGCGGDRDKTKRPLMGAIASQYADNIIITDDNPRSEKASKIRKDIIVGIFGDVNVLEVSDRSIAIRRAIKMLEPDDVLIIAGKGHECYQLVGDEYIYLSDYEEVQRVTSEL